MTTGTVVRPLRVMVVDDHPLVLVAIRQALDAPDVEVVADAGTADEALQRAPAVRPDVLLVDLYLPDMNGRDLIRELAPRLPETKIVVFTFSSSEKDLFDAMRSGAHGYLTKDVTPDALLAAIRSMRRGDLPMSRRQAAQIVEQLLDTLRRLRRGSDSAGLPGLSARERDVLRLLADGMTDREIAAALVISPRTVETHVSSILRKLSVSSRADAARRYRDA
jgi:two-component system response regulator DevR